MHTNKRSGPRLCSSGARRSQALYHPIACKSAHLPFINDKIILALENIIIYYARPCFIVFAVIGDHAQFLEPIINLLSWVFILFLA